LHLRGVAFAAVISHDRFWYARTLVVSEGGGDEDTIAPVSDEDESLAFDLDLIDEEIEPISDVDMLRDFKGDEEEENPPENDEEALELLEYTLNLFESLKEALGDFYHDERYRQTFVEKVEVLDTVGIGNDLARYVEDELFMEAAVHTFDPIETMGDMAFKEIGR
jgi:hypothetical protein